MYKYLFYTLILGLIYYWFWLHHPPVTYGPGMVAPKEPAQLLLETTPSRDFKGYTVTPVAKYAMRARVLAKKRYKYDEGANIVPFDLALGWGRMSDESVLDSIKVSQSNRFYFWKTRSYPIPHNEIVKSSANVHFIPGNDSIMDCLMQVKRGNVIDVKGYLVNLQGVDGWNRTTSLSRSDDGAGACEIVFARYLRIVPPETIKPVLPEFLTDHKS